jgi:hypothetical protein
MGTTMVVILNTALGFAIGFFLGIFEGVIVIGLLSSVIFGLFFFAFSITMKKNKFNNLKCYRFNYIYLVVVVLAQTGAGALVGLAGGSLVIDGIILGLRVGMLLGIPVVILTCNNLGEIPSIHFFFSHNRRHWSGYRAGNRIVFPGSLVIRTPWIVFWIDTH